MDRVTLFEELVKKTLFEEKTKTKEFIFLIA